METAAFFDIDGPLIKGWTIYSFGAHLNKKGLMKQDSWEKIECLTDCYRASRLSYQKFARFIVDEFAIGLEGQDRQDIKHEGELFWLELQMELYSYAIPLVNLLRKERLIVAISGSPVEALLSLKKIGFQDIFCTQFKHYRDKYTGGVKLNLALEESKRLILENYIKRKRIDLEKSLAFGDTEQDTAILEKVGVPIALNPSPTLQIIARERKWHILFADRDDVIDYVRKLCGN